MLEYNYKSLSIIDKFLDIVSSIVVNMIVVIMATKLFRNISVDNMFYLFITATLIMIMNKCVKPLIKVVMLPLNIFTLYEMHKMCVVLVFYYILVNDEINAISPTPIKIRPKIMIKVFSAKFFT